MKTLTLIFAGMFVLAGCGAREQAPVTSSATVSPSISVSTATPELWIPQSIETCINSVRDEHAVKASTAINPFYLRADFDSDGKIDHAVLVESNVSDPSKRNGVLICIENKPTALFGAAFSVGNAVTSFENDNVVTGSWEVVPKSMVSEYAHGTDGRSNLEGVALGDVIAFFHEGGAVYIFWDGSRFKIIEGS